MTINSEKKKSIECSESDFWKESALFSPVHNQG
jgi:hypothetical protein